MSMPGFTAEASLFVSGWSYQAGIGPGHDNGGQGVIPQLRAGGRLVGGRQLAGFWDCAACVFFCSIITGDPHACLDACVNSGACEATA